MIPSATSMWPLIGVWCAIVSWFDMTQRRIPNALLLVALAFCVAGYATTGQSPWGASWLASGAGAVAALLAFLPLYATRVMGAGDVKLFVVIGVAFGPVALLPLWLMASVLSASHALVALTRQRMSPAERGHSTSPATKRLPYGAHLAMAVAAMSCFPSWLTALTPQWLA